MKTIHFLVNNSDPIIDYLISPIGYNKRRLIEMGYRVRMFSKPSTFCFSCDILCLVSKVVLPLCGEKKAVCSPNGPVISFLKNAKKYTNKIIWFDTADSTGVTHFELLPYIDLYLKKQIYKDKSLYQKNFYGGRIFTDFYHKSFDITDEQPFNQFYPLDPDFAGKLQLSWNIGLGDMYSAFSKKSLLRRRLADFWNVNYNVPFFSPKKKKPIDIFLRTSANLNRASVSFQRRETIKRLKEILGKNKEITGDINGERLSDKVFRKTMADTKILPSPFGWGELGVRDYEAFIYGALLLKPDISHMATWPDIFKEGITYQHFDWDFSNLESLIVELLDNTGKRREIAQQGQSEYKNSISNQGMERFCIWFINQIEK
jgi:hypothetical protein